MQYWIKERVSNKKPDKEIPMKMNRNRVTKG
jgi:hypothetical protein